MPRLLLSCIALSCLASCMSQEQLDASSPTRVFNLNENYQAVYARTNKSMRKCLTVLGVSTVDGQLYPELGYGEITSGVSSLSYSPNDYVKVSKVRSGAIVEIKHLGAGKKIASEWLEYWVRGGSRCPVGPGEVPPRLS